MSVAEGLVIVIAVGDCLCRITVLPGYNGSNLPESIPDHRIIHVEAGIWLPSLIDMHRTILFPVNLAQIVKAFIQNKAGSLQRLPGFMIVFIHLDIIGGCKILGVTEHVKCQICPSLGGNRITSQNRVKLRLRHIQIQPDHALVDLRRADCRRAACMGSRTSDTLPELEAVFE